MAFKIETLEARFYSPVCVWSAAEPENVKVLEIATLQPLAGVRATMWGTTTEFAGWKGNQVLVRVYVCTIPEEAPTNGITLPDPGIIISYDIQTKKIALEP